MAKPIVVTIAGTKRAETDDESLERRTAAIAAAREALDDRASPRSTGSAEDKAVADSDANPQPYWDAKAAREARAALNAEAARAGFTGANAIADYQADQAAKAAAKAQAAAAAQAPTTQAPPA